MSSCTRTVSQRESYESSIFDVPSPDGERVVLVFPISSVRLGARNDASLDQALDTARTRASVILSARTRIEGSRGRPTGASVLFQQIKALRWMAGPRDRKPQQLQGCWRGAAGGKARARVRHARAEFRVACGSPKLWPTLKSIT
jgi:hypothetical protein